MTDNGRKRGILDSLGVFSSLRDVPPLDPGASMPSLANPGGDILGFLLDLLSVLAGFNGIRDLTGRLITRQVRRITPRLKRIIADESVSPVDGEPVTPALIAIGVFIPAFILDRYGDVKAPPDGPLETAMGRFLPGSFDGVLRRCLDEPGTWQVYANLLRLRFLSDSGIIHIRVHERFAGRTTGEFIREFIESVVTLNATVVVAEILDLFFGTWTTMRRKSRSQLETEESDREALEGIIYGRENFFEYGGEQVRRIRQRTDSRELGGQVDFGCGIAQASLSPARFTEELTIIANATSEQSVTSRMEIMLTDSLPGGTDVSASRQNYFKGIAGGLLPILLKNTFLSPGVILLFIFLLLFRIRPDMEKTNSDTLREVLANPSLLTASFMVAFQGAGFYIQNRNLLVCIAKQIKGIIVEAVFAVVRREILRIVIPAVRRIAEEQIANYTAALRGLSGGGAAPI